MICRKYTWIKHTWIKHLAWILIMAMVFNVCLTGSTSAMGTEPEALYQGQQDVLGIEEKNASAGQEESTDGWEGEETVDIQGEEEEETADGQRKEEEETADGQREEEEETEDDQRKEEEETADGQGKEEEGIADGQRKEEEETADGQREVEEGIADGQKEEEETVDGQKEEEEGSADGQGKEEETADGQKEEEETADGQREDENNSADDREGDEKNPTPGQEELNQLVRSEPISIPDWYTAVSGASGQYWTFIDRWGGRQYRTYGSCGDHPPGWMACDRYGEIEEYWQIDTEEEDQLLAPYRYESSPVDDEAWNRLQAEYGLDLAAYQKEVLDPYLGQNYDGTNYDIWWLSEDLDNWDIPVRYVLYGCQVNGDGEARWYECSNDGSVIEEAAAKNSSARTVHTIHTVLWHLGCPSLASSYKYQSVTAKCGDTINFVVHEYRYSSSKYDTPMDQGDSDLNITSRFIYNGRSGANWVNLCGISGRAPGSASIIVRPSSAGTWYAGHTYTDWDSEGSESGVRKSGQITIKVSGHNYDYSITPVAVADCTAGGVNKKACACGLFIEEEVPALGHDEPEVYNTTGDNGTYFKDCTRCGLRLETKDNPYTVRFDGNQGEGEAGNLEMIYGTGKELPTGGFTRTGYTMKGWNTLADGTGEAYSPGEYAKNLTAVYGETVTLYAIWEPIRYTVVFDGNNGNGGGSITTGYEQKLGKLPKAEKTGCRFLGWFTEKEGGEQVTADTLMPLEGGIYYAHWEICRYPITWESHGGSFVEGWICEYDTELGELPDVERIGYTFEGWHETSGSDGNLVTEKTRVPVGGAVYHARWKANRYPIIWESHGGSGVPSWFRGYETELGILPETVRAGYLFEGWYEDAASDMELVTEKTEVPLGGAVYHARWKAIQYPIIWESHGGSSIPAWNRDYDTKLGILPAVRRDGYTFEGWYKGMEPDADPVMDTTKVPLNGAVYHARWKAVKYPVTWNSHGGTGAETWNRDYDTEFGPLPDTERVGYSFKGWYTATSSDAEAVTEGTRVPLGGMNCHAWWQVNQYRIVWDSRGGNPVEPWERDYDTRLGRLPVVQRKGYTFEGWHTGCTPADRMITEETEIPLGGAIYHAWWKAVRYPIIWDSQGGEEVASWNRGYETELGKLPNPEREGYILKGWKTATASDAEYITEKTTVPFKGAAYYADWEAIQYPIIWNSMGGVADFCWTLAYDTELGELPEPVRFGYRFEGWYTSETFEELVTERYRVPLEGAMFYARWVSISQSGGTPAKEYILKLTPEAGCDELEFLDQPATVHVSVRNRNLLASAIGDFAAVIKKNQQNDSTGSLSVIAESAGRQSGCRQEELIHWEEAAPWVYGLKPSESKRPVMVAGILTVAAAGTWLLWMFLLAGRRKKKTDSGSVH